MATDDPAAIASDPDGREVVLLARIWEDKIARDHPELVPKDTLFASRQAPSRSSA